MIVRALRPVNAPTKWKLPLVQEMNALQRQDSGSMPIWGKKERNSTASLTKAYLQSAKNSYHMSSMSWLCHPPRPIPSSILMKGTEVPNPRCSSACDCTCVLTRNRSLSRDSLTGLAMHILFCSCPCKVRSWVSDALSQALCNISLAFLADFTLSHHTAPIRFIVKLFSHATYTLLFVWIERQDHCVHMSSIL